MTLTIPGSRSNRMLTQRVISDLGHFYSIDADHNNRRVYKRTHGPIEVTYDSVLFEVHHSGNIILTIDKDAGTTVFSGGYHDRQGNPTSSTRELINGVMDTLEAHGKAPHVRVYISKEERQCFINVSGTVRKFDQRHPQYVIR